MGGNVTSNPRRIVSRGAVLAAALACLAGCRSTSTRYVHPNADISAIKRVAVLPFENLTGDRAAAENVHHIFLTELLALNVFEVAEPGEVLHALRSERIDSLEALSPADFKKIGAALKVDGLFLGTLANFEEKGGGGGTSAPEVSIQSKLIEVQSGVTIWSVSQTRSGAGAAKKLFGVGGESLLEAARTVVRAELRSLLK